MLQAAAYGSNSQNGEWEVRRAREGLVNWCLTEIHFVVFSTMWSNTATALHVNITVAYLEQGINTSDIQIQVLYFTLLSWTISQKSAIGRMTGSPSHA